jgi:hypothetical protein
MRKLTKLPREEATEEDDVEGHGSAMLPGLPGTGGDSVLPGTPGTGGDSIRRPIGGGEVTIDDDFEGGPVR